MAATGPRAKRVRGAVPFLVSLALLAAVWEVAGRSAGLLTVPPLTEVLGELAGMVTSGELLAPLADSLRAFAAGMAISIAVGISLGTLMGLSRTARVALDVYVKAGLSAPMIAFVPVFLMLFGLGSATRIATVVAFSVWVITVNTATGIAGTDPSLLEMARSFGARGPALLREVRLPQAAPYVLAGLRLGVARGVKGLINGEVLIAIVGIGGLIKRYGTVFSMAQLYAVILFIIAFALLAVGSVGLLGRIVFRRDPEAD